MTVEAVSVNQPMPQQKQTGGGGKAVASAFFPGTGQFMDDRYAAGGGFMAGTIGLGAVGVAVVSDAMSKQLDAQEALDHAIFEAKAGAKIPNGSFDSFHTRVTEAQNAAVEASAEVKNAKEVLAKTLKSSVRLMKLGALAGIAALGFYIYNIVDAYKGKKA